MPKFDGIGPAGKGPKTGRGQGNCDNTENPSNNPCNGCRRRRRCCCMSQYSDNNNQEGNNS